MSEENLEQIPAVEPAAAEPSPYINPRKAIMDEIAAAAFKQHAEEASEGASVPSVDDEHNITEPAAAEPEEPAPAAVASEEPATPSAATPEVLPAASAGAPASESIDPEADYMVVVEGQELTVKGKTIIDAGRRTLQKEASADHKLRLASQLLEEAERRSAATPQGAASEEPKAPTGKTEAQLAHDLQFGTPEESTNAVRELRAGGLTEERILQLADERSRLVAADEFEFRRGQALLHRDFKALMENYGDLPDDVVLVNTGHGPEEKGFDALFRNYINSRFLPRRSPTPPAPHACERPRTCCCSSRSNRPQ